MPGDVDLLVTDNDHAKFPTEWHFDFPTGWGVDLAAPDDGEIIGRVGFTLAVGPDRRQVRISNLILDHNGHAGHPTAAGRYHWVAQLESTTSPDVTINLLADDNFADVNSGHLHLDFAVPQEAIDAAAASNMSVHRADFVFFGPAVGGGFLTNPASAGTYTFTACVKGLSSHFFPAPANAAETKCPTSDVTIETPTPTQLFLSPISATRLVSTTHTETATVLDQLGQPMAGVTVNFSVAGVNSPAPLSIATNTSGQAVYSYIGTNVGTDTITATADSLIATATVNWTTGSTGFSQTFTPPSLTTPCTVGGDHNDLLGFGSASHDITPDVTTGGIEIVGSAQQTIVPVGFIIAGLHIFASDTDFGGGNCVEVPVQAGTYLVTTTIQVITPTISAVPATPLGRESAAVDALVLASSSISSSTASLPVACTGSCSGTGPGTLTMTTSLVMPLPGILTAGGLLRTRVSALGAGTASAHGTGTVLSVTVTKV